MIHAPKLAALAVVAALALTGCAASAPAPEEPVSSAPGGAGSDPADAPDDADPADVEPDAAALTGPTIEGTGYSFQVPEGWTTMGDAEIEGTGVDTMATDTEALDGFNDNVNVIVSSSGPIPADQFDEVGAMVVTQQEAMGATDVELGDVTSVAGADALTLTATLTQQDIDYRVQQFYVNHGDDLYIVTFSFGEATTESHRADLAGAILASWAWD